MNAYMNFINDATLYAILQALTSLNHDIKEEIIFRVVLYVIDENLPIPDYIQYV